MNGILTERLPQRFRYTPRGHNAERFGACFPNDDGTWSASTQDGLVCEFVDDPWEVLSQMVGDCVGFRWIDKETGWHQ